jgi:hypothetical protein
MCGIIGFFNKDKSISKSCRDWFENMLIVDSLRGWDATGVALFPREGGEISLYKKALPGWDFIQTHVWSGFRNNYFDYDMMLGHNRFATSGKVTNSNAHPFMENNVLLMHNGVINNEHRFPKADVDSRRIALALGEEQDYKNVIEKIVGAFVLVWFDFRTQKLHFARNNKRTLYLANTANHKDLFWASEKWMLEGIAERCGLKLTDVFELPELSVFEYLYKDDSPEISRPEKIPFVEANFPPPQNTYTATSFGGGYRGSSVNDFLLPFGLKEGDSILFEIYEVSPHKNGHTSSVEGTPIAELDEFQIRAYDVDVKVLKSYSKNVSTDIYVGTVQRGFHYASNGKSHIPVVVVNNVNIANPETINLLGNKNSGDKNVYVMGPNKSMINLVEYKILVDDGCALCGKKLYVSDYDNIVWTHDKKPICGPCVHDWDKNRLPSLG